jgi:hypothetical protein
MDVLPTIYEEFSKYPLRTRRSFFQKLSPKTKAEFWRNHLYECLKRKPELTQRQVAVINSTLNLITPELFARGITKDTDTERVRIFKAQEREIFDTFTKEEGRGIFAELGGLDQSNEEEPQLLDDEVLVLCTCNELSDWCPEGSECLEIPTVKCQSSDSGCGTLWLYMCLGLCGRRAV